MNWFQNYLTYRTQAVAIKGATSAEKRIPAGVPQGSVLGRSHLKKKRKKEEKKRKEKKEKEEGKRPKQCTIIIVLLSPAHSKIFIFNLFMNRFHCF